MEGGPGIVRALVGPNILVGSALTQPHNRNQTIMTMATTEPIRFPRSFAQPQPLRRIDAERAIIQAISERRLMSVTYNASVEPQPFAPYVLYFDAARRVFLGGCEITRKRTHWRDLEVAYIRSSSLREMRFTPGRLFSSKPNHYPHGLISAVDVSP